MRLSRARSCYQPSLPRATLRGRSATSRRVLSFDWSVHGRSSVKESCSSFGHSAIVCVLACLPPTVAVRLCSPIPFVALCNVLRGRIAVCCVGWSVGSLPVRLFGGLSMRLSLGRATNPIVAPCNVSCVAVRWSRRLCVSLPSQRLSDVVRLDLSV
jgi:hypothetical protein